MSRYKNKRIAIVGLSVEGIDSAHFFAQEGANVWCLDRRDKEDLSSAFESLKGSSVSYGLGEKYLNNLSSFDVIVRSPGVSPRLPEILLASKKGIKITSQTQVFFEECAAPIIGVTGTKGKGTTSTLIAEILKTAGHCVHLGGNVGIPLLSKVRSIKSTDYVVLELSSFQLEDVTCSPHIAVVLRITQDHLANYDKHASNYHPNREAYIKAKLPIVLYQKPEDIIISLKDDPVSFSFIKQTHASTAYTFSRKEQTDCYVQNHCVYLKQKDEINRICTSEEIQLRGEHNLENIAAATLATIACNVMPSTIHKAVLEFKGLEHRLEFIREIRGVKYFNDSFSTVPETTIAALDSFQEPIILIAGGSEKGSDFTDLGKKIAEKPVKALLVIGDMAKRISDAAIKGGYQGPIIKGCKNMKEIITATNKIVSSGDVVLLSPACASFDMFPNYKVRAKLFKDEVAGL